MTYAEHWKAISARIKGLLEASRLDAQIGSDGWLLLGEHCIQIASSLEEFSATFEASLPAGISGRFQRTAAETRQYATIEGSPDYRRVIIGRAFVLLSAFESEITYRFSDTQSYIRAHSELAFEHLQRSIVADESIREKWRAAHKAGEVQCEKLGAVHLLAHGIWAFKVDAAGERTDLVFQETARDMDRIARFAEGLVLTEWKKIVRPGDAIEAFGSARGQAKAYASGSLGGSELRGYRYAVVVSQESVNVPEDLQEAGVLWRHINIAVTPTPPSRRSYTGGPRRTRTKGESGGPPRPKSPSSQAAIRNEGRREAEGEGEAR